MCSQRRHGTAVFVNVDDVKDHLSEYNIFDVRFHLAKPNFNMERFVDGHIPGATPVNLDDDLCSESSFETGRHPLPECSTFILWCQSKNISPDRPVLCYDEQCGAMGACRLWWLLDNLNVEAYVLNGGYQAYYLAGLPVETGKGNEQKDANKINKQIPMEVQQLKEDKNKELQLKNTDSEELSVTSTRTKHSSINDNTTVINVIEANSKTRSKWPYATSFSRHYLLHDIPPNAMVVDMRSALRFHSTVRPFSIDTVPGHLCGSINLPYESLFTTFTHSSDEEVVGCTLRPTDEIKTDMLNLLSRMTTPSVENFNDCVFHCGSGVSACFAMAVIRHIGLGHPFLYCGSWSQYSNLHKFTLMRNIIQKHGFCCEMLRLASPDAPQAVLHVTPFCVHDVSCTDDNVCCSCESNRLTSNNHLDKISDSGSVAKNNENCKADGIDKNDAEINAVIPHLYEGEKVKVYFKSGRTAVITIFGPTKSEEAEEEKELIAVLNKQIKQSEQLC